jgi:hypothetical protein
VFDVVLVQVTIKPVPSCPWVSSTVNDGIIIPPSATKSSAPNELTVINISVIANKDVLKT